MTLDFFHNDPLVVVTPPDGAITGWNEIMDVYDRAKAGETRDLIRVGMGGSFFPPFTLSSVTSLVTGGKAENQSQHVFRNSDVTLMVFGDWNIPTPNYYNSNFIFLDQEKANAYSEALTSSEAHVTAVRNFQAACAGEFSRMDNDYADTYAEAYDD